MLTRNPLLDVDSYKLSHFLQYPQGMTYSHFYLESRGGQFPATVFFGLQYILQEYLARGFGQDHVHEAAVLAAKHGVPFNEDGFMKMYAKYGGDYPVRIRAVPEGTVVPTGNVLLTVESTDPEFAWLPGYLETMLLRVWYPVTVTTQSWYCRKVIYSHLLKTADDPDAEIQFKLIDFGSRGVSSYESASLGGCAHLVNFMGSDTLAGIELAQQYYKHDMAGFSIPAAEHSTITSWGEEGEANAYENMLNQFAKPGAMLAIVADSYDLMHAVTDLFGSELKRKIIDSGATLVVRPDSGDPLTVLPEVLRSLEHSFGCILNTKGYKLLNHVRVLWGDGINQESIDDICHAVTQEGYSVSNVAFGMGGALLQQVNRDTQRFAMKCSHVVINGKERDVFKCPKTDPSKKSKRGRLDLIKENGMFKTINLNETSEKHESQLVTVFENGYILREYTLEEIRQRALGK